MNIVERFLDSLPSVKSEGGRQRPETVTLALRQLRDRTNRQLVIACELAWEAHDKGYWSQVNDAMDRPYPTEEAFWEDVLHVASFRTAARMIAVGRALAALPEPIRESTRHRVAKVGVTKAELLVPILGAATPDPGTLARWWDRAEGLTVKELTAAVQQARGGTKRAHVDDDRVRAYLLARMPDLEARELFEALLMVGRRVVETNNTLGILLAAFREALGEWTAQAGPEPMPPLGPVGAQ